MAETTGKGSGGKGGSRKTAAPRRSRKKTGEGLTAKTGLDEARLVRLLDDMMIIREFEEQAATLYREGAIRGVTHTYQGQEAVAVGACAALRPDDYITSTHRGHAHVLAKGADVNLCMAELLGKATGLCKGRGGSMHIADVDRGILGANGIVGGGMGICVGAALASQMLGRDFVSLCFFGDGALNQGILHEVSNMAAIWTLPVVFLVENNLFGMSAPCEDVVACDGGLGINLERRATAYGMPGVTCDGMDVVDVYLTVKAAVDRARKGEGPSYVVCDTYRFLGHHVGDPLSYRTKEEVLPWRDKDPIPKLGRRLVADGLATEGDVDRRWEAAKQTIRDAMAFAEASPEPEPTDLTEDVFA